MFFAGAMQLLAALLFWSAELAGRLLAGGTPLHTVIPATWAHAFLMIYAVLPFFIFGFLLTTLPRWLEGSAIPPHRHLTAFVLLASGVVLFYAGLFFSKTALTAGVTLLLAGWGAALRALLIVYRNAQAVNKRSAGFILIALAAGWLGLLCYLLWLVTGQVAGLRSSLHFGVWLFLLPALVAVSDRVIPRLSRRLLACAVPDGAVWLLPMVLGVAGLHVSLALAELPRWFFIADLPLAIAALYHTLRWRIVAALKQPVLTALHIAFLWFGIALLLSAIQSLYLLLGNQAMLGTAPVHVLGIGFATTLTLALATRLSLRYAGQACQFDNRVSLLFSGISVTALLCIAAEIPALAEQVGVSFYLLAALSWLLLAGIWTFRFAPQYFKQRAAG